MYVMRTLSHHGQPGNQMLTEMTWPQYRRAERAANENCWYCEVPAQAAHKWVRDGGLHDTPLWVDDTGRIRRA
jgi:hypothetical protein